jgi:hypothetical protein
MLSMQGEHPQTFPPVPNAPQAGTPQQWVAPPGVSSVEILVVAGEGTEGGRQTHGRNSHPAPGHTCGLLHSSERPKHM